MSEPSLQRSAVLSLLFHLGFLFIALLMIKKTIRLAEPLRYTISLVSPDKYEAGAKAPQADISPQAPKGSSALSDSTEKYISEAISALEAKKRVEKVVRMRNIVSLKKSGADKAFAAPHAPAGEAGSKADIYLARVRKEIWQNWAFPEAGGKNLEAVVSIKILKDGTIKTEGFEKSSGNSLFDRSAIRAIAKSNPLPPPPYEMEMGIRFYP